MRCLLRTAEVRAAVAVEEQISRENKGILAELERRTSLVEAEALLNRQDIAFSRRAWSFQSF